MLDLSLLRQRNYALLWSAAFISRLGDFVLIAALPYFVYSISGSTIASGATFVSETVPAVLCSTVGGVYADRWRRKPVLASSDWLRGLVLLPLLAVHSATTLWIVYAVAFFGAAAANFAGPFGSTAVPHVVGQQDLPRANAALSAGNYVAILIGSPIGGILLQHVGLPGIVLADGLTFVASGLLISKITVDLERQSGTVTTGPEADSALARVWREWIAGSRYVTRERWVRTFFLVTMLTFLANSISLVILAPFVRHTLGGSPQLYSWMLVAQGLGAISCSVIAGRVTRRLSPAPLLTLSILIFGMLQVVIALAASVPVTLAGTLLGGSCVLFIVVNMTTLLQTSIPDMYRGRVFGAHRATAAVVGLVGSLVAGFLGDSVGIRITLGVGGVLFVTAGVLGLTTLGPVMRSRAHSMQTS